MEIVPVEVQDHRAEFISLNIEYLEFIAEEIRKHVEFDPIKLIGSPEAYAEQTVDQYVTFSPPNGISYLVLVNEKVGGMGFLHRLRENIGEIKRLYIRPQYRGRGYGKILLNKLIQKAREFGFTSILLESARFLHAAIHLYRVAGFQERGPYAEVEAPPRIRHLSLFMEKHL